MWVQNTQAKERENYKGSGKFQYKNSVLTHRKLHLGNRMRCLIRFHRRFWSLLLQSFSLTGISICFNLLYTITINTYICFMSFTDTVSYSNTHFMDFPSPLANNNILFMIPSAFPSLGFILALSNCTQIVNYYVLFLCAWQGVWRGQGKLSAR